MYCWHCRRKDLHRITATSQKSIMVQYSDQWQLRNIARSKEDCQRCRGIRRPSRHSVSSSVCRNLAQDHWGWYPCIGNLGPGDEGRVGSNDKVIITNCIVLRTRRVNKLLLTVFSACGGIRTGSSKPPVLTAYFPVLAYGWIVRGTTTRRVPYWANGLFYPS